MKKIKVIVSTELVVEFDENSKEFQVVFENYNKGYYECNHEQFAEILCDQVARYGAAEDIEGIGSMKINGKPQKNHKTNEDIDHPINIKGFFNIMGICDFDTEIEE